MSVPQKAASGRKVALALMKSTISTATIEVLQSESSEGIAIVDRGTYWLIEADDEIRVDMERVSEELGEPISLSRWLVSMSSYVGRAAPGIDYFRVTSRMVDLDGNA